MNVETRVLMAEEVRFLVDWAGAEGWNPSSADADAFRAADPEGFIGCFVDGQLVAGISAVAYGASFGFIGLYICHPDYRGRGFGMRVWQAGMARLAGRTIGLDGVPEQQANYANMGFVKAYETVRWSGSAKAICGGSIFATPVKPDQLEEINAFDARFFPDERRDFLKSWLSAPRKAFVVAKKSPLDGYAVLRKCTEGYKLGPLFANDFETSVQLLAACANAAGDSELHIDVPVSQIKFAECLSGCGFSQGFETARMYFGPALQIDMSGVFAITTLELG